MVTEYDDHLGYDADHDDPSQFCRHGTFIGSWWGPDYMCYYCETGEEPPTQIQADNSAFAKRVRKCREDMEIFDAMTEKLSYAPFNPYLAHLLIETALYNEGWAKARWYCQRKEVFR